MPSTLTLLTGPDGPGLVGRVLAASGRPGGGVEVARVHHRPAADTTVSFTVTGARTATVLITDAEVAGIELEAGGVRLRGWLHPDDPRLTTLASALDPRRAGAWLAACGVSGRVNAVDLLAYRPLRRAVVRLRVGERCVFLKLWGQRASEGIERHRLLDRAGVGPRVLGEPASGVLVLDDLAGEPLAERLAAWNAGRATLPDPREVPRLLDGLPRTLLTFRRRDAWCDRLDFHAVAAASAVPDRAVEIDRIVRRIEAVLAREVAAPLVPTHGDLYEANVFVEGVALTRLIDVDTAGPGRRVDDLACLLGHMAVLPDLSPAHYGRLKAVTGRWASVFEEECDPAQLRARTAGVIVSLVPGATREHALARIGEAARWLQRAEERE